MKTFDTRDKMVEYHLALNAKTLFNFANSARRTSLLREMHLYVDASDVSAPFVEHVEGDTMYKTVIRFVSSKVGYGKRVFVVCPACKKRVNALYIKNGLRCRACSELYYCSSMRQRNKLERLRDLISKKQKELRMSPRSRYLDRPTIKPKWMHWKTYERLLTELLMLQIEFVTEKDEGLHRFYERRR